MRRDDEQSGGPETSRWRWERSDRWEGAARRPAAAGVWRALNRREFIRVAALAAGTLALPACGRDDDADAGTPPPRTDAGPDTGDVSVDGLPGDAVADAPADDGDDVSDGHTGVGPELPSLGGAPDTPEGRTIAAFVDTIVPGSHRDPTGAPGALDVDAAALFFDPNLPALPLVGVLAFALDGLAGPRFDGRQFVELVPAEREVVVEAALEATDLMAFAIQLAKLAYLSSPAAGDHLGYPGANPGYVDHPDFTFGEAMASEITEDGNHD